MKRWRLTGIGFAVIWLGILTAFSVGSISTSEVAIYALLAALIGLKRSYLIRLNGRRSVVGALAYGAALNFGPFGGAVTGALVALGQHVGAPGGPRSNRMFSGAVSGAAAGLAAGYAHASVNIAVPFSLLDRAASILLPAAACFGVMMVADLIESRRCGSALERLKASSPLSAEFAVGIALAAATWVLYRVCASELMLLVMPVVYLTKQALDDLLFDGSCSASRAEPRDRADLYLEMIHSLVNAMDARDRFTRSHTANVTKLALSIARKMRLSADEIEGVKMAGLLHDIGKLWVPEHILLKPGRLNPDQFTKIQQHPTLGQKVLDKVNFPWPVGAMIRGHHERWDGTGYPDSLKEEQIPIESRILCLADVYDAMTSKRSYRASNTVQETLRYIREAAGTHFDPAVVRAFEQVIADGDLAGVYRNMIADSVGNAADEQESTRDTDAEGCSPVEDISRANSEFIAVFEIAQTATTSLNLEKVLYLLAGKIKSMISCSTCVIFLRDKNSDRLEVKTALGANAQHFEGALTTVGSGQTGIVVETGRGMIAKYDKRDLPLVSPVQMWSKLNEWIEPETVMMVPITSADGILGAINLYRTKEQAFSDEEFLILTAVAPQVGKAIQNALLFKQTTQSAVTDLITGLHNARHLFSHLEKELNRAKRLNTPVSVLGLDLDNFKAINDVLGHQQGDVVLRDMSQLFVSQVRNYDLVSRYAGDEFIIVLPDTDKAQALETAQRIEKAADRRAPYGSEDKQIRVGVSVGVATFPEDGEDARTLIARADLNMYADKKRRKKTPAAA